MRWRFLLQAAVKAVTIGTIIFHLGGATTDSPFDHSSEKEEPTGFGWTAHDAAGPQAQAVRMLRGAGADERGVQLLGREEPPLPQASQTEGEAARRVL